jgi:hypothetical protein
MITNLESEETVAVPVPTVSAPVPTVSVPVSSPALSSSSHRSWSSQPQQRFRSFFDTITDKKQEDLTKKLGKFIFSANLPFNVVENKEFQEFVTSMRPAYKLPSHETVGGKVLDRIYDDIEEIVKQELHQKHVTIMQDGWSDMHRSPVIAHSLSNGSNNYFIKAHSTGSSAKTAVFCAQLLEAEIDSVEEKYGCKIVAVVTDNCNTMESMKRIIKAKYPELIVYGCNSHLLNLVGKSLTPENMKSKVVTVQSYFRNNDYERARLSELKGLIPVLPGDTRWNSQLDCFESYIKNQTKYLEISRETRCKMPEKP